MNYDLRLAGHPTGQGGFRIDYEGAKYPPPFIEVSIRPDGCLAEYKFRYRLRASHDLEYGRVAAYYSVVLNCGAPDVPAESESLKRHLDI